MLFEIWATIDRVNGIDTDVIVKTEKGSLYLPAILLGLLFVAPEGVADVYKRTDAKGHAFYTDEPKDNKRYQLVFRSAKKASTFGQLAINKKRFSPIIKKTSKRYSLDPLLIHALIRAESGYDPKAISSSGAVGLMQLMPATAKRYGVKDRRNPAENVRGGVAYFRDLLKQFNGNIKLALAAYNAGENAVIRYGNKIPPYPETENYVAKVMAFYKNE